jgi:hypothetical protein
MKGEFSMEPFDLLGALITERGSKLLSYEVGRAALIRLPSQEVLLVSIGTSTMKVFDCTRRLRWSRLRVVLFGWLLSKTVLCADLSHFGCGYKQRNRIARATSSVVLLVATVDLLTQARSVREVREKYTRNWSEILKETFGKHFLDLMRSMKAPVPD